MKMEEWMEKILLELNSISRVAVIEGAYGAEHMLRNYAKILKYHWSYENKKVTAYLEFLHLKMFFEYEKIKQGEGFQYKIEEQTDLKALIIPHDVLDTTISACIEELNSDVEHPLMVKVSVLEGETMEVVIEFSGQFHFIELSHKLIDGTIPMNYDLKSGWNWWKKEFGEKSISLKAEEQKYLKIVFKII